VEKQEGKGGAKESQGKKKPKAKDTQKKKSKVSEGKGWLSRDLRKIFQKGNKKDQRGPKDWKKN